MTCELLGSKSELTRVDLIQELHGQTELRGELVTVTADGYVYPNLSTDSMMLQAESQYTKLRWLLTIFGLILYLGDIFVDIKLAVKYYEEENCIWAALTLVFVVAGLLVTQMFSYAWYKDDINDVLLNPEGTSTMSVRLKGRLAIFHLFGFGIFHRYYRLLKYGFGVVWTTTNFCTVEESRDEHHRLFCQATDLSMLKLFETFLESAPQLLLQLYIMLGHNESSVMQYLSVAFSLSSIAWSLVDYRRCLRRSLPHVRAVPSGLPTAVYLLYKFCTISSHILSYSLLLMLSTYSTIALVILWLLGITWTHLLHTNFCSSRSLEFLYRAVIGVILTFTYFNVKGQDTKISMAIYYFFYSLIHIAAPILLYFLKPELQTVTFFQPVGGLILGGSLLGLVCLVAYYLLLHPRGKLRVADEVDGLGKEAAATRRIRHFLQP